MRSFGLTGRVFCAATACDGRLRGIMAKKSKPKKQRANLSVMQPEAPEPSPRGSWSAIVMAVIIAGLCAGLYAWTTDFPFEYDDYVYMIDNPWFKAGQPFGHWSDIRSFVRQPLVGVEDPDLAVNIVMRPIAYLTLQWNHLLGGFDPRGFRVVNILIHALNGWLMFLLVRRVAGKVLTRPDSALFVAAVAALAFTVHPLATESVTYIIQRFTSMGTMLLLGCLVLYFASVDATRRNHRVLLRLGAVLCALAGMLVKEDIATVPLLAVGIDWLLLRTRFRTVLWRALPLLLCLPLVPVLTIICSRGLSEGSWSVLSAFHLVNLYLEPWGWWEYFVSELPVIVEYLRLIVWPAGQNLCPRPPSYDSLLDGPVLTAVAVLGLLIAGSVSWWRRSGEGHGRLVAVFFAWYLVTVFISSGLVPLPNLMAEHRAYLPSVGVFVMLACLLDVLRTWRPSRGLGVSVCSFTLVALASLSWATCARNEVWRSAITLWEDTTTKSPRCYVAWVNLGAAEVRYGDRYTAVQAFRQAVEIRPRVLMGYYNLADSLVGLRQWPACVEVVDAALGNAAVTHPLEVQMLYYKGLSLAGMGRVDEGMQTLERVLDVSPDHFYAHKILGACLLDLRQTDKARVYLQRAVELNVNDPDLPALLAQTGL
jgi:hypothetical protein